MQEETSWVTKSRMERIDGERNTRYFHRMIKRNAARIMSIRDDVGNDIKEPERIQNHITSLFEILYTSNHPFSGRKPNVSNQDIDISYAPSNKEIKDALNMMKPLKALGPDGFHPIFFKECGV